MAETWRVLEDVPGAASQPAGTAGDRVALRQGRLTWLLAAGTALAVVGAVLLLASGPSAPAVAVNAAHGALGSATGDALASSAAISGVEPTDQPGVVVEVDGAVRRPGIYRLAPASRVGDAIAAAGGYGARVDATAAQSLNLAARIEDGQQIHVPVRGEAVPAGSAVGAAAGSGGGVSAHQPAGPINVNTAGAPELEALPGIGPATAAKIIAARAEKRFASVDELGDRRVIGAATLEKIRNLVVAN